MDGALQKLQLLEHDSWMQHIPIPRLLDVVIQVLENCQEDNVLSSDLLEDVLPHLCFALPHNTKACSRVLRSLPLNSSVWNKVEEGLSHKENLPVEITATLYEQHPSALESEMLRILNQYAETVCMDDWCKETALSIVQFKPHGESLDIDPLIHSKMKKYQSHQTHSNCNKINFWSDSPIIVAAAHSHSVFSLCVQFLCCIVVQSNFSIASVSGSRDYFAEILNIMNGELYEFFPSNMQHLVYLLTLPLISGQGLKYFENFAQVSVVQDALSEEVQGGEVNTVRSLLCFFSYWFPVLEQYQFVDKYLRQGWELPNIS